MRVLITGVAGFIGMHAAIRLLKEGWTVVGIDNLNDYYDVSLKEARLRQIELVTANQSQRFVFHHCDINSNIWNNMREISFDSVIHLAAQAGVRYSIQNPSVYLHSNILGFQKVLDFVKSQKIKRFIYASSSSVYGNNSNIPYSEDEPCDEPESYYAATKRSNELSAIAYCKTYGTQSIGLRFFTVYGPWGRPDMAPMLFASAAYGQKRISVFNHGNQERDFTFIDDIIESIYRLVILKTVPKKAIVLNIGNGAPVGLMNFIQTIEETTQINLQKDYLDAQVGDVAVTYADTSRLTSLISFKPSTNLKHGIKQFLDWYKSYYN